jgi:glycosyltransferase involved in cell wall biosynthesis
MPTMMRAVLVNARFETQAMTGVQRFAGEICRELLEIWPAGWESPAMLRPGRLGGHGWEQGVLPFRVAGGVLVNLGNTAPVLAGRQVVVIHDAGVFATPEAYSWGFRSWYAALHRLLVWRGVRIVTVSAFSRDEVARVLGVPSPRIAVLGEGAEHMLRRPAADAVLKRNGLVPGRFVLAVGSLAAHKNLVGLQATAAMLAARGMELVITGGMNVSVFAAAALPSPARLVGRVDDAELRGLYEAAACFVFPSRYEGFGLPAVEAMACGCPVVAARAGALPEVCGDAAVYADPADGQDFARVVATVLDDAGWAGSLRSRGLARAAEMTWRRAALRLLDVIGEVAA